MTRPRLSDRALLSVLALSLAVGSGCAEFGDPWAGVPAGRLEGRVTTGVTPVEAVVCFERLNDDHRERFEGSVEVDDDGSFGMDVPAGDYLVYLRGDGIGARIYHAEPQLVYDEAAADTIPVTAANSPVRIGFALGWLDPDLTFSPGLEDYHGQIRFYAPGSEGIGNPIFVGTSRHTEVENGWFLVQPVALVPGEYQLSLELGSPWDDDRRYVCEPVWLPGARDVAAATRFGVTAGAVSRVTGPVAVEPLRVEGRVGGAWLDLGLGNNPELTVVDLDSLVLINRFTVGEDGTFGFDLLLPAEFKLRVAHYSETGSWFGGPSFESAEIFTLGPGETLTGLEYLQCGLRLLVADPPDDVGDAWCGIYDAAGTELLGRHYVYFGSNHEIGIPNLSPGTYLLRFDYDTYAAGRFNWRPQWYDRAATSAAALPITIDEPGDIVTLDLVFETGGVIAGSLALPAASNEYYVIIVYAADSCQEWAHYQVNAGDPDFTFRGLPDGRFKVGAVSGDIYWDELGIPPPGAIWYPATPDWNAAGVVEIVDAATVSGVDLVIPGA
ncbi:MAG: hypothetical protein C0395_08040 [Gemmatimonas sp.]|nr:hypothetical protein [Gemmatimonas sp.]